MRVLISVYDKAGIVDFATKLVEHGCEIISTGGTASILTDAGIDIITVEEFTGSPEILGGRVKTLHPYIHGGILANPNNSKHLSDLKENDFPGTIDIVVCNLYPFQKTLEKTNVREDLIEQIDIGGVTLLRASAKNVDSGVAVVSDPNDYEYVSNNIGKFSVEYLRYLATKAFVMTAEYDKAISDWMIGNKVANLRYGENPHQKAKLISYNLPDDFGVAQAEQLHGKELSYNNYLDLDAVCNLTAEFIGGSRASCAIMKHTNACGLALDEDQATSFIKALSCDPVSAFGSIIGFNGKVSVATATAIVDSKLFVECTLAPDYEDEALKMLKSKSKHLRILKLDFSKFFRKEITYKVSGGLLIQNADCTLWEDFGLVTNTFVPELYDDEQLKFALQSVKHLKSNAIALVKDFTLIGMGTGQPNRIDALGQAAEKAKKFGFSCEGAYMASDAFFPFNDCVLEAARLGIKYIIQPGGSKRDQDSIDACNEHGIAMRFTNQRHFRH